jgi:hypothetical protein
MGLYIDIYREREGGGGGEKERDREKTKGYRFNDDFCQRAYWLNHDIIGFALLLACWLFWL